MAEQQRGKLEGKSEVEEFAERSSGRSAGLLAEFWEFLRYNKKWWLLPIIVVLLLVSVLIILGSSAAAPFIYTLF